MEYHPKLNKFQAVLLLLIPGMRILKTGLGIILCVVLFLFFDFGDPVTAAVAVVICTQANIRSTFKVSIDRAKGTMIAGVYGFLVHQLLIVLLGLSSTSLLYIFLVIFLLMPMMHFMVFLRSKNGVAIASIVYLIICFSSGLNDPFWYAANRIFDTLVGIVAALLINWIPILNQWGKHLRILQRYSYQLIFHKDNERYL